MNCGLYSTKNKSDTCAGVGHYLCETCLNFDLAYRESFVKVCSFVDSNEFWKRFKFLDHAYSPEKHGGRVEFFKKFIEFPVDILKEKV